MTKTRILIVADDLTGANDTAIQFRKCGFSTLVITHIARADMTFFKDYDVISMNSDSRGMAADNAYRVLNEAVKSFEISKNGIFVYKKVDSMLRGNPGHELAAIMDAMDIPLALAAPSFPANRSVLENGRLPSGADAVQIFADGTGRKTSTIPLETIRQGAPSIAAFIQSLNSKGTQVFVADAVNDTDLEMIYTASACMDKPHILTGSAGLANQLARKLGNNPPKPSNPVIADSPDNPQKPSNPVIADSPDNPQKPSNPVIAGLTRNPPKQGISEPVTNDKGIPTSPYPLQRGTARTYPPSEAPQTDSYPHFRHGTARTYPPSEAPQTDSYPHFRNGTARTYPPSEGAGGGLACIPEKPIITDKITDCHKKPTLLIAGSRQKETAAQILTLSQCLSIPIVHFKVSLVMTEKAGEAIKEAQKEAAELMRRNIPVCIIAVESMFQNEIVNQPYVEGDEAGKAISGALATLTGKLFDDFDFPQLISTGGDTSMAICQHLGISTLEPQKEICPGIPLARIVGGTYHGRLMITKSGRFGEPDTLLQILDINKRK